MANWRKMENLFLQRTYLEVLEKFPPDKMQFAYLLFFENKNPVGIAVAQIQLFQATQNIQEDKTDAGLLGKIGHFVKEKVAKKISFYTRSPRSFTKNRSTRHRNQCCPD